MLVQQDCAAICYQVLLSSVRKFHSGSTWTSSRSFTTDRYVSSSIEQADVDPYSFVQKDLDAVADSIRKVRLENDRFRV